MKETRETSVQNMAKLLVFASNLYAGESKDQSAVYEIKNNRGLENERVQCKIQRRPGKLPYSKKEYLKYGGNTSCVEVNAGGHLIVLDAGTGLIDVGNELLEKYIASGTETSNRTPINAVVLLSHIHHDHIQGFTFLDLFTSRQQQ